MLNWNVTPEDHGLIYQIVARAINDHEVIREWEDLEMDITATHLNGCPLDLQKFLDFPTADFLHDIYGIIRHLNRKTGQLEDCFDPRCSRPIPYEPGEDEAPADKGQEAGDRGHQQHLDNLGGVNDTSYRKGER